MRGWYGAEPIAGAWNRVGPPVADAGAVGGCALRAAERGVRRGAAATGEYCEAAGWGAGGGDGAAGGAVRRAAADVAEGGYGDGARAKQATAATGVEHVPVFWLATEDHDLAELDHVDLLGKNVGRDAEHESSEAVPSGAVPVGGIKLDGLIEAVLDQASELLGYAPVCEWLRECYGFQNDNDDGPTLGIGVCAVYGAGVCGSWVDGDGCGRTGVSCAGSACIAICH